MKNKINLHFFLVGGISIFLSALLLLLVFYGLLKNQVLSDLKIEGSLISQSYEQIDNDRYLADIAKNFKEIRITLIDQDGRVLFDSFADYTKMENHSDRPEIMKAKELGQGEAIRKSDTLRYNTFYFAIKQKNGNILRLAKDIRDISAVFISILPIIFFISVILIIFCLVLSSLLTKRILQPISALSVDIENIDEDEVYDELVPFISKIKSQKKYIDKQVERLSKEKSKIQLITNNMEEGLILLNSDKTILTINQSAVSLLSDREYSYQGKNILYFSRNAQLLDCVDSALAGVSKSDVIHRETGYIHIFANPVYDNEAVAGVICLILDITDRIKAEKNRREFTANVSHELKTPLTSISGYAELISNKIAKPEDIESIAGKIYKEAQRLILLINDIIKLSQLDEPGGSQDFEKLNIFEIAKRCAESLELSAQKKNIHFETDGKDVLAYANRGMLEELIFNLCDNAIRYTNPGGTVSLKISSDEKNAVISVQDNGIGIPKKDQNRIFERFYRVDKSRSKATGGTGLGLSIVKHITEQHNGRIALTSEEGKGTEITVTIPV